MKLTGPRPNNMASEPNQSPAKPPLEADDYNKFCYSKTSPQTTQTKHK